MNNKNTTYQHKAKVLPLGTPTVGFQQHTDYDEAMERSVLGVCLLEPEAFGSVYGTLTPDCFYKPTHHQVYDAMHTLWQSGQPVDLLTLTRQMYDSKLLQLDGDNTAYYLTRLMQDVVNSAHLHQWCRSLRSLAARRRLITLTSSGLHSDDIYTTATHIQEQLQQALEVHQPDEWINTGTAAKALTEHMDAVKGKEMIGISTTFRSIDKMNGGFRPGQLVVIGARPSVGKSALMGAIATEAARQGNSVGIISLEMPAQDLFGRILSYDSKVAFSEIDRNRLRDDTDRRNMHGSMQSLATLPIWFSERTQVNIHDIRARAEKLKRSHGLKLLIVDYLQLVEENTSGNRSREQGISAISRGLKMLAMNLEIPVIALSQLNRESENRAHKKPTMADLRESGAIEQDADIIMLLHRDWRCGIHTDAHGNSTERQADLIIAKWRNGSVTDIKLTFDPQTMRFGEEGE